MVTKKINRVRRVRKARSASEGAPITVSSEQQAFNILEKALNKEFEGQNILMELKNWPMLEISLKGKGYSSTITADVAESIANIQKAVNRAYAAAVKQHASAIHLTDSEKASIRFKAKVSKGSSLVSIDLSPATQAIANNLIGKMTGTEIVITVLGLGAIWASGAVVKQVIKSRADNKNITTQTQHQLGMSQEETRRLEIVTGALAGNTALTHAKEDFDEVGQEILKSVGDADTIRLNGVEVDRSSANEIVRGVRQTSRSVQLNGQYIVSEASFKREDATKISVRRSQDGREFSAAFQDDSLDQKQLAMLKDAAFEKKPVFLSINGTELRGNITTATIVEVREIRKSS